MIIKQGLAIAIYFFSMAFSIDVFASSFCGRPVGAVEKHICGNGNLVELDLLMNNIYSTGYRGFENKKILREEQISWIKKRNRCKDDVCIESEYRKRIEKLKLYFYEGGKGVARSSFYLGKDAFSLVSDEGVWPLVQRVVGARAKVFLINSSVSSGWEALDGGIFISGCAQHLCNISESKMFISKGGDVFVSIMENGNVEYYSSSSNCLAPIPSFMDFHPDKKDSLTKCKSNNAEQGQ